MNIFAEVEAAEITLKINAPMSFGTLKSGNAIALLTAKYPELRVQLTFENRFIDIASRLSTS